MPPKTRWPWRLRYTATGQPDWHMQVRVRHTPLARGVITHAHACQVRSLGTAETWICEGNGKGRSSASPATWRGVVGTVEGSAALRASKDACFGAAATPLPAGRSVWLSSPQTEYETRLELQRRLRLQQHSTVLFDIHMVTGHRPAALHQMSSGGPDLISRAPFDVATELAVKWPVHGVEMPAPPTAKLSCDRQSMAGDCG